MGTPGKNDYTLKTTPDANKGYCSEVWTISDTTERCVNIKFQLERLFKTNDNGNGVVANLAEGTSYDIDFGFRNYAVTAGWRIPENASAGAPALMDFASTDVDFSRFLRAPELYYKTGALSGLSYVGSALAAVIFATTF